MASIVVSILAIHSLTAQEPGHSPEIVPAERVGLNKTKLANISHQLQADVAEGRIAGAVALVARHGRVAYLESIGDRTVGGEPMTADTLFRIASMTKAVTSAAVMSLVEDGTVALDQSVADFLPELADLRVLKSLEGDSLETIPADRIPTIHDLLTHRSGFTYGWFGPPKLNDLYSENGISDFFTPTQDTMSDRVKRLSELPLKFQPGTAWNYSVSTDVLGRVVEVASGLTLDQFFHERFFRPLEMRDTFFIVPREQESRLAGLYTIDQDQQLQRVMSEPVTAGILTFSADSCLQQGRKLRSGGAGLVSTAPDYFRFLQMLLNEGELDGVRVLKADTVRQMTRNQIGEMTIPFPGHGDGFGLGFGVLTDAGVNDDVASVGTYSWGGIFNTYFWVDPQDELIGLLMTQIFPYDHLDIRKEFKQGVYDSLDDSGFTQTYSYVPGAETANPHFNGRQLRVNSADASLHPSFGGRSEVRSSGMARILVEEDPRQIVRAELHTEIWGGHPGTGTKAVTVNGRRHRRLPDVGTTEHHCTHQYPVIALRRRDLVNGYNSLQFSCEESDTFWGHYVVDGARLKVTLPAGDERLADAGLQDFHATVDVKTGQKSATHILTLSVPESARNKVRAVHFQGRYTGFDENGNTYRTDWHGMTKGGQPYGIIGSATDGLSFEWDTSMLPAQQNVQVRALVEFEGLERLTYQTPASDRFEIQHANGESVTLHSVATLPTPFWSRAAKQKTCDINIDLPGRELIAAELHVVAWTGGAGNVRDYFTLNGHPLPIAEGHDHEVVYSRIPLGAEQVRTGINTLELLSDTEHHGIEILRPGPVLVVRSKPSASRVKLQPDAIDESASGLACYRIQTPNAVFFLDKIGAGLSSVIDRDGNDWLNFEPTPGSGAAGEYRGFPNAVFKSAGSYFHPLNANTDRCRTRVESVEDDRIEISAVADNGLWAGIWSFTAAGATFRMTKMPADHSFWFLYEGTPGGQYDDNDWWMSSSDSAKHPLTENQDGDLAAPEWMAFGDPRMSRCLVLLHHEDDPYPDRFYQMERKMTVFGFGRDGMKRYLRSVPQTVSLMLVEADSHDGISAAVNSILDDSKTISSNTNDRDPDSAEDEGRSQSTSPTSDAQRDLERFERHALVNIGDAERGKKLFFDGRLKCADCHRLGKQGRGIGPDLTKVGGKFDRPHLIDSILRPSRQINYGYETHVILLQSGKTLTGVIKNTDADRISVGDVEGQVRHVDRSEIEERTTSKTSLMPAGITKLMSVEDFTDLVAFLEQQGGGSDRFGGSVGGPVSLPQGFVMSTVATGLSAATALEVAPDGRVFICEQRGTLRVVQDDQLLPEPFATLPVELNWERGLIGVTVSPEFPDDPYVYTVTVVDDPYPHHRISRWTADGNQVIADSEVVLLEGDNQNLYGGNYPAGHQGGAIHFGPDECLYIAIGEQTAGRPAQQMDALQGKILRIRPDGSIPEDNPFLNQTNGKYRSIWALGCRNPFTFAFHRTSGQMLINDVGGKVEEINPGQSGANYGWPTVDHGHDDSDRFVGSIHTYPQSSISGADFCDQPSNWTEKYRDRFFFADFVHGWVRCIDPKQPQQAETFVSGIRRPVDLRFAPDGSLFVLLRNAWVADAKLAQQTGSLMRIRYEPSEQ